MSKRESRQCCRSSEVTARQPFFPSTLDRVLGCCSRRPPEPAPPTLVLRTWHGSSQLLCTPPNGKIQLHMVMVPLMLSWGTVPIGVCHFP